MFSNQVPSVNGISPREGTPGTKLTIRGENLGTSISDILHVWMNKYDVSCTVQWHSTKKLNILSSLGEGTIKIIVETKSGGRGTCDVEYYQTVSQNVGLQEQVSYWPPNELKQYQVLSSYAKRTQPKQIQSEMMEDMKDVMLGTQNAPIGFALSDEDLSKIYKGRGSTALTEADFNPVLFLLKYHHGTGYNDLVNLLDHYRKALATERVREPISIVKANLYTIFQCLECLEALKNKIDEEKTMLRPMSGAFAENELCRTLEDSKNIAHQMFEEVLKRRDYADSARSALSVMERFKFLFNLPRSIRENISKGEYSTVINEYLRARSLFGMSEIRLFQQVYKDVVDVIDKFKDMLRRQLIEMPTKCDTVKVTIRLMRQLEVDYDPTLVCLESQKEWILQNINKLNTAAFTNMALYKGRLDKLSPNSRKFPIVLLIDELNKLLSDRFNETWSLACYYLDLDPSGKGETTMKPMEDRVAEVEELVHAVFCAYSSKVRESLVQGSLQPGWLVYCVQHVRQAIETLPMEDLPKRSVPVLVALLEELRTKAVRAMLLQAEQDIAGLTYKENWIAEISDDVGATTRLPALYRNLMLTVFSEVNRVIKSRHAMERPVCSSPADEAAFVEWISSAMRAYVNCADNILEKLKTNSAESPTSLDPPPPTETTTKVDHSNDPSTANVNMCQYLLLMANNCQYCTTTVLPSLLGAMGQQGLPGTDAVAAKVMPSFVDLQERLVSVYVDIRLLGLIGPIESGMCAAGYDWRDVPVATMARGYVHDIVAGLGQAHSELDLICPHLSRRSVLCLGVRAVEELHRVVEASDRTTWSRRGHQQLLVDLGTLDLVLGGLCAASGRRGRGNDGASDSEVVHLCQEAVSLVNVLRGSVMRLSSEEHLSIKAAIDGEARTLAMIIGGLQD